MTGRKKPLRWRKQAHQKGLASIGEFMHGRPLELTRGGKRIGTVSPCGPMHGGGWYFYASLDSSPGGDPGLRLNSLWPENTGTKSWPTCDEAKAACLAWVKEKDEALSASRRAK